MRKTILSLLMLASALIPSGAHAQAMNCGDLWWRRNYEYKASGYCFRTARAIRVFGNAGCQYDDVNALPMPEDRRAIINDIIEQEREMGCR